MRTNARHAALLPLLIAASALGAESGTTLSRKTPFGTVRSMGAAGEASGEAIEFAAVSTIGKTTELVFHDKTTKKNTWLAKGETKAGITLLNYDAGSKQAVVKVNGVEKTLALRKSQGPVGPGRTVAAVPTGFNIPSPAAASATMPPPADATAPAMPLPVTPAGPQTQAQQETEARMLVSDLLEIGMAQRKAYEEKQRQATSVESPPPSGALTPTGAPKS